MTEIIPNQQKKEEVIIIKSNLIKQVNIETIITSLKSRPTPTSWPLEPQDFTASGINKESFNRVETEAKPGSVVILAGVKRMGKTSLGTAWLEGDRTGRAYEDLQTCSDTSTITESPKTALFIDEVGIVNLEMLKELVAKGKEIIVSTELAIAQRLQHALAQENINTSVVIIGLATKNELEKYVGNLLGPEIDPRLISAISKLSGGSTFIASRLCASLIENSLSPEGQSTEEFIGNWLQDSFYRIRSVLNTWDEFKVDTPKELWANIPDPLIRYLWE